MLFLWRLSLLCHPPGGLAVHTFEPPLDQRAALVRADALGSVAGGLFSKAGPGSVGAERRSLTHQ